MMLICSVEGSTGWEYAWFRRSSDFHNIIHMIDGNSSIISVSKEGRYYCYGRRGNPVFFTEHSDMFRVEMTCEFKCIHDITTRINTEHFDVFILCFCLNVNNVSWCEKCPTGPL